MKSANEWARALLAGRGADAEEVARVKELVLQIQTDALRHAEEMEQLQKNPPPISWTDGRLSPLAD